MTNEQAKNIMKLWKASAELNGAKGDIVEAMNMAIKALQQGCEKVAEGCDDLIRRQDAIDAIWDGINYDIYTREVKEILEDLPSARPERKKGKWIDLGFNDEMWGKAFECSICGEMMIGTCNYCFNCGAEMKG